MSLVLKYNIDALRSSARDIRKHASEHADAVDRATNLVYGLPEIWEGRAQEKLVAQFTDMRESYDQFEAVLESLASALEEVAASMEEADINLKKIFEGIGMR